MNRVTEKQLQAIVDRINRETGSPMESYTKDVNGKFVSNVGNYHLSFAYGGVSLHRMANTGGGVHDVFSCGHVPKRELAERMWAYCAGMEAKPATATA